MPAAAQSHVRVPPAPADLGLNFNLAEAPSVPVTQPLEFAATMMPASQPKPPQLAQTALTGPVAGGDGAIVSAWLTDLRFDWATATRGARTARFAKDEILFLEGQTADTVYVIETGRVRLASYSLDGRERHLMIMGPNGLIGDCGLLACDSYVVSAIAAADAVVKVVAVDVMLAAIESDARLFRQLQTLSGIRFRIMLQHLALLGSNSARRRVCHHLIGLMNSYGSAQHDGTLVGIRFTQLEMGRICGLSRVSVSHIFSMLEREGTISHQGRLVVIRNSQRLTELSTI